MLKLALEILICKNVKPIITVHAKAIKNHGFDRSNSWSALGALVRDSSLCNSYIKLSANPWAGPRLASVVGWWLRVGYCLYGEHLQLPLRRTPSTAFTAITFTACWRTCVVPEVGVEVRDQPRKPSEVA